MNPKNLTDSKRSQKERKVVINIINGGNERNENKTMENILDLSEQLQTKEKVEVEEIKSFENNTKFMEESSEGMYPQIKSN